MYKTGLVSISFRQLDAQAVIDLCLRCELQSIEWGGDGHVPHGDLQAAERVGELTRQAGLAMPNYGSYYRLGHSESEGLAFSSVLASAKVLGAADIRVWAGNQSWSEASDTKKESVLADLKRIGQMAGDEGLGICLEYHAKTFTDDPNGAAFLLEGTTGLPVRTLWQPPNGAEPEEALATLLPILPRLSHLHVFHWWPTSKDRHPLAEGLDRWKRYLDATRPDVNFEGPRYLLLEFVRDNDPANLPADAATLRELIG